MDSDWTQQLEQLRHECVSTDFLEKHFGIKWPPSPEFESDFQKWAKRSIRRKRCEADKSSRWAAERFLQDQQLQPLPWMAARLGMSPKSLKELIDNLPDLMRRRTYLIYPDLVYEAFVKDLTNNLEELRFKTFLRHDDFCRSLHAVIKEAIGIDVEPEYCVTSIEMNEFPRLYAYHLDSLTLKPLSVRHTVWLDLGKPISLAPDICSKLFYVKHRDVLNGLLAGNGEPDDLDLYDAFIHEQSGSLSNGL